MIAKKNDMQKYMPKQCYNKHHFSPKVGIFWKWEIIWQNCRAQKLSTNYEAQDFLCFNCFCKWLNWAVFYSQSPKLKKQNEGRGFSKKCTVNTKTQKIKKAFQTDLWYLTEGRRLPEHLRIWAILGNLPFFARLPFSNSCCASKILFRELQINCPKHQYWRRWMKFKNKNVWFIQLKKKKSRGA